MLDTNDYSFQKIGFNYLRTDGRCICTKVLRNYAEHNLIYIAILPNIMLVSKICCIC